MLRMPVEHADFSSLRGKHALLVTYKRDGTPVPTPVWFAHDGKRLVYVWTEVNAYKVRRVRNDPRALLAPCTPRGVPTGNPIAASGRVLTERWERQRAAFVIRKRWGLARRLFERLAGRVTDVHYLAFSPAAPDPSSGA